MCNRFPQMSWRIFRNHLPRICLRGKNSGRSQRAPAVAAIN
jgi:hypothetical protein